MSAEYLPNPGSFNEFQAQLQEWGYEWEGEGRYLGLYEIAVKGLQSAIEEQLGISAIQRHNPEFLELAA